MNQEWERTERWREITILLYGEEAVKRGLHVYDLLKLLKEGANYPALVISILDQAERISYHWQDISRACLAIGMANPSKIPELVAILADLLDDKKNPQPDRGKYGIKQTLYCYGSSNYTRSEICQGIILGTFQLANYLDENFNPLQNDLLQIFTGLILSQSALLKQIGNESEPQKKWKRELSTAIEIWVQGRRVDREVRQDQVELILLQVISEAENNPDLMITPVGAVILKEFDWAKAGLLTPLQLAAQLVTGNSPKSQPNQSSGASLYSEATAGGKQDDEGFFDGIPVDNPLDSREVIVKDLSDLTSEVGKELQPPVEFPYGGEKDAKTHYNLAIVYKEMDRYMEAIKEIEIALNGFSEPDAKADCLVILGIWHKEYGNLESARKTLLQALELEPLDNKIKTSIWFHLALISLKKGFFKSADQEIRKCLALEPDFEPAQVLLEQITAKLGGQ